jgi:hypothetical protein
VELKGAREQTFRFPPEKERVESMSATFYKLVPSDSSIRSIRVTHGYANRMPEIQVSAFPKIDGRPQGEADDWTVVEERSWCLDRADERLVELTVLVSDGDWKDPTGCFQPEEGLRLAASNVGCRQWKGQVVVSGKKVVDSPTFHTETSMKLIAALVLQRAGGTDDPGPFVARFRPGEGSSATIEGTITQTNLKSTDPCSSTKGVIAKTMALGADAGTMDLDLFTHDGRDAGRYRALLRKAMEDVPMTAYCSNGEAKGTMIVPQLKTTWWDTGEDVLLVSADGRTLEGKRTVDEPDEDGGIISYTYDWKLESVPESGSASP